MTAGVEAALHAVLGASFSGLEWAAEVDSTNAWALRAPLPGPGVRAFIADTQFAGRGRRGRVWQSPPGANLYLSLMRGWELPLGDLGPLSICAGIAVAEVLRGLGLPSIHVKWPNDLMVEGRKVGGLLVEVGAGRVVLGLGLNVALPDGLVLDQPATDLNRHGLHVTRDTLLQALLPALIPLLMQPSRRLEADWLQRWAAVDGLADAMVDVIRDGHRQGAQVLGLQPDGSLRVATLDGGEQIVHAGEVSLRGH